MAARATRAAGAMVIVGVGVGVLAEALTFHLRDVASWAPDLLAGLAFVAAGAATAGHRRAVAYSLLAVAGAWFLGTVFPLLLHVHRGPLVHVLLTAPGSRRTRLGTAGVVVGYAAALVPGAWRDDRSAAVLLVGLVTLAAWDWASARGRARADRRWTVAAVGAFAAVLLGGMLLRRLLPLNQAVPAAVLAYELVLVGLAAAAANRARPRPGAVVDLVVELGEAPPASLRDALALAVRDPTLQVGYWSPDGYRDGAGADVVAPPGPDRVATFVEQGGKPLAILVHDATVLDDPALVDAVTTATRLSAAHAALTDEARTQLAELERSGRRLVLAADEERRRLEARLHHVVKRPLTELVTRLRGLRGGIAPVDTHVDRAADHLADSLDELGLIACGLHPRELDQGLARALASLTERCPLPVRLDVEGQQGMPPEFEVAASYLVAEALSNTLKYGSASRVRIAVRRGPAAFTVEIVDDGRGGARPSQGSGLSGLRDRVAALGGSFEVSSGAGNGTRVVAELPLEEPGL